MSNSTTTIKTKSITVRYIIALSLIAILSISAYILIRITLYKQASDSPVVNLAGRQRMLPQKLTKEVLLLVQSQIPELKEEYLKQLKITFIGLSKVRIGLQHGNEDLKLPGNNSKEVQNLFAEMEPYYQKIKRSAEKILVLQASELKRLSFQTLIIQDIVEGSSSYLELMNRTVFQYDDEAQERVDLLTLFETSLFSVFSLHLVSESKVIFCPRVNKLRKI